MNRILWLFLVVVSLLSGACTGSPAEHNYTAPSWTLYRRALQSGKSVEEAKAWLISKDDPYNINITINGDPSVQMGVAWFTNAGVTGGVVQVVEGKADDASAFDGAREIPAVAAAVDSVNYVSTGSKNDELIAASGFAKGEKRSYTSNKTLLDGLKPGTVYSYRVGKPGAWSETGTFTTAKEGKDAFAFIYATDTQANTDEMFDTSKKTLEAAYRQAPDASFLLVAGDFVESAKEQSAEWEWEQWFEKMQNVCLHLPIVPVQGNHDVSPFGNWFHHFNTDNSYNAQQTGEAKTDMGGTIYSFVYGDALFLVINYEDCKKGEPYFAALEQWMRRQVADRPDVKWRIAAVHKSAFTGGPHQSDSDARTVRERMAPVLQELRIDLVIQGHDHVYEVIKAGDVLYFLNNSAGKKKYDPMSEEQMKAALPEHGVENYFSLFSRLGQTGEPTFSRIQVSTAAIDIATYTVDNSGKVTLYDTLQVTKRQ